MDDTHEESPFVPFADLLVGLLFIVLMMIVLLALEVRPEVKIPPVLVPAVSGMTSTEQKALQAAEAKLDAATREISDLKQHGFVQDQQIKDDQLRIGQLNKDNQNTKGQLAAMIGENAQLRDKFTNQGKQIEKVQTSADKLNSDKVQLQASIDTLSRQILDERSKSAKLLQDYQKEVVKGGQIRNSVDQLTILNNQLEEKVSTQDRHLQSDQSQINALNSDKTRLQATIDYQRGQIKDQESQALRLASENQQYQGSTTALTTDNRILRSEVEQLNRQIEQLTQKRAAPTNTGDLNSYPIYDRPDRSGQVLDKLLPLQRHRLVGERCVSGILWRYIETDSVKGWIDGAKRC